MPAVVDLAAMRDAIRNLGGDPKKINPLLPAELVIDHSVQVDKFGAADAFAFNAGLEMERNIERYAFLRWGQKGFENFKVVPPDTGICHQVNLEYLARVVFSAKQDGKRVAFPDSLVGTDSHTTMVNGLGVFGWGVGGIEAEAAMLGQPLSMLIPAVVGFKLHGRLPEGATATDLVLTVTQMLRKKGVVGKFVEFYGTGLSSLTLPDRATIANMAPEYGATMGFFPVDAEALAYLRFTARSEDQVKLVEAYTKEQGIFRTDQTPDPIFSDTLELDLATVVPTMAGPKRPQDSVPLTQAKVAFEKSLTEAPQARKRAEQWRQIRSRRRLRRHRRHHQLHQHFESVADARRRLAREESRRARPHHKALGENQFRSRLESRHRLHRKSRPLALSRSAALPSRRLRLHHLHRQQRSAVRSHQQSHQGQ